MYLMTLHRLMVEKCHISLCIGPRVPHACYFAITMNSNTHGHWGTCADMQIGPLGQIMDAGDHIVLHCV